jgi:hypothetical protein
VLHYTTDLLEENPVLASILQSVASRVHLRIATTVRSLEIKDGEEVYHFIIIIIQTTFQKFVCFLISSGQIISRAV